MGFEIAARRFKVACVTKREQGTARPCAGARASIQAASPFRIKALTVEYRRLTLAGLIAREQYFTEAFRCGLQYHPVFQLTCIMTDDDERMLQAELARLQQEHRDLDAAIDALHQSPAPDLLRLQRLKKRKLQLRDRIAFIEDQITPDIIA
jgi:hypothetical protein